MATATTEQGNGATMDANSRTRSKPPVATSHERVIFSGMAILILGTVALGFAPTYYFAGVFRAPPPSWVIHVHGASFSTWILLLLVRTSFVSAAILTATEIIHGLDKGKPFEQRFYTMACYARRHGRWVPRMYQDTPIQ